MAVRKNAGLRRGCTGFTFEAQMLMTGAFLHVCPRVQSLLKIVSGFKDQDKRLVSMDAQVSRRCSVVKPVLCCIYHSLVSHVRETLHKPTFLASPTGQILWRGVVLDGRVLRSKHTQVRERCAESSK